MRDLLTLIAAHARHPGRAVLLASFSMTRNWNSSVGFAVRRVVLPRLFPACGSGLLIGAGAVVVGFDRIRIGSGVDAMTELRLDAAGEGTITIGDDCSLNCNVHIGSGPRGAITLGEAVLISGNVVIRNGDHAWRDPSRRIRDQGHNCEDIVIEDDVWICSNTVVLGGAHIQRGAVIASGSVVRRGTYEPYKVYSGNPAVQVGTRG